MYVMIDIVVERLVYSLPGLSFLAAALGVAGGVRLAGALSGGATVVYLKDIWLAGGSCSLL